MNPLFDYEYVCFMFSGLRGWVPLTAQHEITPENPITFVHDDSRQTAIFRVDHVGNFWMDIHDEQGNSYSKIVECSREYMEREFGTGLDVQHRQRGSPRAGGDYYTHGINEKLDIITVNVGKMIEDRDGKERRLRQIKDLAQDVADNPRDRDAAALAMQILSLIP